MRAGKNPTRTLAGARRQHVPHHGPHNFPQAPVEKPQGKAAEQGLWRGTVGIFHVNRTAMRLSQAGDRGLGSRSLGCLGEARSVSKSPNAMKLDLRFEKLWLLFAILSACSHLPSQKSKDHSWKLEPPAASLLSWTSDHSSSRLKESGLWLQTTEVTSQCLKQRRKFTENFQDRS